MILFQCFVHGRFVSKKNSHRVRYRRDGKPFVGNSCQYLDWQSSAVAAMSYARWARVWSPGRPVLDLKIYLAPRQRRFDEDNALGGPMDALQKAGITQDDRDIKLGNVEQVREPGIVGVMITLRSQEGQ